MRRAFTFACLALLSGTTQSSASGQENVNVSAAGQYVAKSKQHGTVEIRRLTDADHDGLVLEVTYKPKGTTAAKHASARIVFKRPDPDVPLQFKSLVDKKTGNWVVYDTLDLKFVFMALPPTEASLRKGSFKNYWHPGVHIGWARGIWIHRYRQVRKTHPKLPYEHFVGEQFVIVDSGSK